MLRVLFSPRMVALHLLALVAVGAAVWLGLWQYGAWQSGREAEVADLTRATPRALDDVMSPDDPFPGAAVGRPVELRGRWVSESTVYVQGRGNQGREGYWVVTPVAVCDSSCAPDNPALLVVRGWTAEPRSGPVTGEVAVTGWLQPPEGSGTPDTDPSDDVLPEVRVADAIQHVDQDLYGGYVIAGPAVAGAGGDATLTAVTPQSLPEPDSFTGIRNLLYALEWWVFGGFALFLWWRWCSDELTRVDDVPAGSTGTAPPRDAEVASSP